MSNEKHRNRLVSSIVTSIRTMKSEMRWKTRVLVEKRQGGSPLGKRRVVCEGVIMNLI